MKRTLELVKSLERSLEPPIDMRCVERDALGLFNELLRVPEHLRPQNHWFDTAAPAEALEPIARRTRSRLNDAGIDVGAIVLWSKPDKVLYRSYPFNGGDAA